MNKPYNPEPIGHIYLVDDDADLQSHLGTLLQRYGYSVSLYNSAEAFLQQSIEITPAVLLLDVRMPRLSGVELQERLNEIRRGTPVILMSGDCRREQIIEGFRNGAIDFLWKPFPIPKLFEAIDSAIKKDMAREELMRKVHALSQRMEKLTPREHAFMMRMLDGYSNREIAELEGVTADNIKKYRSTILDKMQAETLAELIVMCREAGVSPENDHPSLDEAAAAVK